MIVVRLKASVKPEIQLSKENEDLVEGFQDDEDVNSNWLKAIANKSYTNSEK
jgi:hypothetical protein